MNHDRITRALSANADAIVLRPADPAAVMRRGSARRNRRRAAIGGLAAVAVAATSFSVATREPSQDVESDAATAIVIESPFDWTVVTPQQGLGYSNQSSVVDGVVYRLSTSPGPFVDELSGPALYRSSNGIEWTEVPMPGGVAPVSLAGGDGVLYAVGTAPTGGLAVAASTDGAASWSQLELPSGLSDLAAEFPGEIYFSAPRVAALSASNVVASVEASFVPDLGSRLPGVFDPDVGAVTSKEGVTLFRKVPCDDGMPDRGCATSEQPSAGSDAASDVADPFGWGEGASYTWEQLGVDARLVDLVGGRTFAFASSDGVSFEAIEGLPPLSSGWASHLLVADGGYALITGGNGNGTTVLKSPDGRSWTVSAELPGAVDSAGLLGGRVAIARFADTGDSGGTVIEIEQPDGSFIPFDLAGSGDDKAYLNGADVSFGPLGVAAIGVDEDGHPMLFHSADGTTTSALRIDGHVDEEFNGTIGVDVTADAITVRLIGAVDDDPSTVTAQQVLVGTPR